MEFCITCGMPLENDDQKGAKTAEGTACTYCSKNKHEIKTCAEIFEGGVQFFLSVMENADRALAERIVRKNMNNLAYWQNHHDSLLDGEMASDEEFAEMMERL